MAYQQRRKKIIISSFQIRLLIVLMGIIVGISTILTISLFLTIKNNLSSTPISQEIIEKILTDSVLPIVVIAAVLFILSLWAIVLITHKIYGPLHRLCICIKKLSDGEKTDDIEFRKGDIVDGLKEIYDDLRKSLEKTIHYNYKEMIQIFSELEDILDKIHHKQIKEKEVYSKLQETCNRLAKALDITSEAIESKKKE